MSTVIASPSNFAMQPHLAAAVLAQLHNAPVHAIAARPSPPGKVAEPEFTLKDLQGYFDIPAKQAAKRLNIGITKLKLVCRQLGIRRWPYRTLRAAAKKPLSKLAARVRKEGILKMIALPDSQMGPTTSSFGDSTTGDDSAPSSAEAGRAFVPTDRGSHMLFMPAAVPVMQQPFTMQMMAVPQLQAPVQHTMGMMPMHPALSHHQLSDMHMTYLLQRFQQFGNAIYSLPPAPPLAVSFTGRQRQY